MCASFIKRAMRNGSRRPMSWNMSSKSPGTQRTEHGMRLSNVMKQLGWQRPSNGYVTIDGKRVKGYFRPCAGTQ